MLKQLSIAIVAISHLSGYSAEAVEPGGACDFLGEYLRENDTNGAYHLLCDGNQYNLNLTLHKDGPVGIGTINPSSGLKLDVEGKVGATDYCDENGENCFTAGGVGGGSAAAAGPEGAIQFNNSNTLEGDASFVFTSTHHVGIGTPTPEGFLHLNMESSSGSTKGLIVQGTPSQTENLIETQNAAGDSQFTVSNTGELTVNTPAITGSEYTGLTLNHGSQQTGNVLGIRMYPRNNNAAYSAIKSHGTSSNASYLTFWTGFKSSGALPHMTLTQGGSLVVGNTNVRDNAILDIARGTAFLPDPSRRTGVVIRNENVTAGDGNFGVPIEFERLGSHHKKAAIVPVQQGNSSHHLGLAFFISDGTATSTPLIEAMRLSPGGNVGIGTSDPAYPLDVVGDIALTGQIHDASDRRLKDNIKPLNAGQLKKLAALQGVSFVMQGSEQTELGLIAQDVEPHFPELVQTRSDGMKTLSYLGFIAPMIEAFKEQQTQLELLQEQVEQLQAQLRQISQQSQPE